MHSARCILAICSNESSPFKYLSSQDAAICISKIADIKGTLKTLIENPRIIRAYAGKGWDCGVRNHNSRTIIKQLKKDFEELI